MKCRKDGQDTQDELQKRNLRDELEEREQRHFSSKDRSYNGKKENMLPTVLCILHEFSSSITVVAVNFYAFVLNM